MTSPRFVIPGSGTAGWMAACLLRKELPEASVTVVESPDIGIIGVGEGSTPQLRQFFATLGIDERQWMPVAVAANDDDTQEFLRRCALNYRPHREALERLTP
jgi:tryptophan 6-halogenase